MKKIICYGDSNTYGYDARSYLGSRYPKEVRWTGILDADPAYHIINQGQNGREIPADKWDMQELDDILAADPDFDLLTIMLGTNDMVFAFQKRIQPVVDRMDGLLGHLTETLKIEPQRILLIAPPQLELARYGQDQLDINSRALGPAYEKLAQKYGTHYVNAASWNLTICPDGAHLTPESHRIFAEQMSKLLK